MTVVDFVSGAIEKVQGLLTISEDASDAMRHIRVLHGPQVVVASWPAGATYLPDELYQASPFDVTIGHVAGCPIYADSRQLAYYADRRAVLDIVNSTSRQSPILVLRQPREEDKDD